MSTLRDRLRSSALAWLTLWAVCCAAFAWPAVSASASCARAGCTQPTAIAHASSSEGETEESEEASEAEAEAEPEPGAAGESEEAEDAEAAGTTHAKRHLHGGGKAHRAVSLSALELTAKSRAELRVGSPPASAIGFSLSSSARTKLQVTLFVQSVSHGRIAWLALSSDSLTLGAVKGHSSHSLTGHNRLAPGTYRLTVKPAGGASHSIYLTTGR
ncbi:MAG TPA: hypothetical protein VFW38_02425 [Solirubrobacteraceae bacterium]|nr:hypothetical protein [Solirubrobacteraceae bacterium]